MKKELKELSSMIEEKVSFLSYQAMKYRISNLVSAQRKNWENLRIREKAMFRAADKNVAWSVAVAEGWSNAPV